MIPSEQIRPVTRDEFFLGNYCLSGTGGSVQEPLSTEPPMLRAVLMWFTTLHRWLLIAVTLARLSLADGIELARTCSPTVRRQPESGPAPSCCVDDMLP